MAGGAKDGKVAQKQGQEGQEGQEGPSMVPDITFPPIGEPEPDGQAGGDGDGDDPKYAALERQLEDMKKSVEDERQYYRQTIDRLIQGQQPPQPAYQQQPPQPAAPPQPDFSNLPDPVDKPEDFQRELSARVSKAMEAQREYYQNTTQQQQQQFQSQTDKQRALDEMWSAFQRDYSDLAPKQTLLRGAIAAEKMEMQQRGVDFERSMFADQRGFMERIANRMRAELGTTGDSGQGDYTGGQGGQGNRPPQQNGNPPNRTGGLGGGSNYNGKGAGGEGKHISFSQQLKNRQMNDGLI